MSRNSLIAIAVGVIAVIVLILASLQIVHTEQVERQTQGETR